MVSSTLERETHREHYELEKTLAARLKTAPREERRTLYSEVYDELYRKLPNHPGNVQKQSEEVTAASVRGQLRFVSPFIDSKSVFLEIGAGDCALTRAVAARVAKAYALEVSAEIAEGSSMPVNMELMITDGLQIPVPRGSVDVIFSNQVMEHLHPDDAFEQLKNIHQALASDGLYVCLTPNGLSGPHDVSSHFDTEPTGFHLKEYTITELAALMKQAGFRRIGVIVSLKFRAIAIPAGLVRPFEAVFSRLPHRTRNTIGMTPPVRQLLGIHLIGHK